MPDINNLESKWENVESKKTPDLDQMDIEQYQVSDNLELNELYSMIIKLLI